VEVRDERRVQMLNLRMGQEGVRSNVHSSDVDVGDENSRLEGPCGYLILVLFEMCFVCDCECVLFDG